MTTLLPLFVLVAASSGGNTALGIAVFFGGAMLGIFALIFVDVTARRQEVKRKREQRER